LGLAEFMVMWRWGNVLLNDFLSWRLKMLLLATRISVKRQSQVAPGLKSIRRCKHL
jgi:hypothetical protein